MRSFASVRVRLLASTIFVLTGQAAVAQAVPLPSGGSVSAGSATINQQGATTSINQTSNRAVIDWKSFSIGAGNSVNVLQPGSNAALLNRVTGTDISTIAGSLTANGQVFLVNRNGILVDPSGKIDAHGGFIGSTLDIKNDDFMAGRLNFAGGGTGSIVNHGAIAGGAVALLGSRVANLGTIVSPLGKVAIGSAQQATLDLNGDGFLQVAIPAELGGADGAPLIDQRGLIDVGGGLVVMRAATAREIVRQTINMAGIVRATSVSRDGGSVVLDGGDGGTVAVSGTIDASGVRGGKVDISGGDVALTGATIAATGSERGGLVRIGGAFQGGVPSAATGAALADKFTTRFGALDPLRAARTTTIDGTSSIDASGGTAGGTVVVWSAERTRQLGTITAKGMIGGAVELSSNGVLTAALSRVTPGRGGSLLLDPKNILVYDAYQFGSGTTADPVTGSVGYGDNSGSDSVFNVADIKALMEGGTDVTLRASNDIGWNADLALSFNANLGNLALSAGRSVSLAGYLTLNQSNLTVVANDTLANGVIDADRDPGAGEINAINAHLSGGTASGWSGGKISLTVANGAGVTNAQAGGMRLSSIEARSIAIDAGPGTVSLFDFAGGIDPAFLKAVDGVTISGAIKVQASGGLTISGRSVDWRSEATSILSATSPATQIRFIEDGVLTRFGILNGGSTGGGEGGAVTDTTRLALGHGGAAPAYSAVYGNAYGAFDALHLVSGSLQGSDTLDSILASGSINTSGPAVGLGVGDYAVTTSANTGFGLASGVAGYFINLGTANDTLRITPKALTATVTGGAYTYGAPNSVASLTGLVGSDVVGLSANVAGLGNQALTANGTGYAFAANMAAGQRDFTLTGLTGAAAVNYTIDLSGTLGAALAIARKSLTYAGTTSNSTYGTLNGASFALSGTLAGDDVSIAVAGVSKGGVTSALSATTNVGTYTTVASALNGAAAGNYVIDSGNSSAGSAIIDPKALTYVTADVASTYGTTATLGAPVLSGVVGDDVVSASAVLNKGAVALDARTAAGNYNINAVLGGEGAGNYILNELGSSVGVLRVAKLGLGVSFANASMVYSDAIPTLATLTGVVAGDTIYAVGTIDNSLNNSRPDVGTHEFTLSGIAGDAVNNYYLDLPTQRSAILTVTPKPINYSINSQTLTYGSFGTFNLNLVDPSGYSLTAGIIVTNVATGASFAFDPNQRLGAGTYRLTAGALSGVNATNYMIATSGNQLGSLLINPKDITYSALSSSSTYGTAAITPGAVLNGAYSSDDVSANVSVLSGTTAILLTDRTNAGSYRVTVGGLSGAAAGNYVLTGGTDGLVTIAPRTLSYLLGLGSATYGQLATPSTSFFGLLDGDQVTPYFTVNGQELTNRIDAGTYQVEIGGLRGAQGGNYVLSALRNTSADLYIHPAPLSYTMGASTSVYGDPLKFASFSWSGLQFDDRAPSVSIGLADSQYFDHVNAGTYTPQITTSVSGNYYLDLLHSSVGQYVITRRSIGLESFAKSGTFGSTYGITADKLLTGVRATNTVGNEQFGTGLTATVQGITLSSGGYVNAGSYLIKTNQAVGDMIGVNYVVGSIANGQWTVTPAYLGLSGSGSFNSTYGTVATLIGRTVTPYTGDVVNLGGLSLRNDAGNFAVAAQTPVGSYAIIASSLAGADARNYLIDPAQSYGSLTIAPKLLNFNTGNLTSTYGTLASLGNASLSGIVGSDQVSALNRIAGYTDRSNAGSLQFDAPLLTGAAASNYRVQPGFGFQGYLTIAPKALGVTYLAAAPSTWTYGDLQDPATFFALNGILSGDTVKAAAFGQLTGAAAGNPMTIGSFQNSGGLINAGTYRASAVDASGFGLLTGASAGNYVLTASAATNAAPSFTVKPRTISGALTLPATATYGDAPAITVNFTNSASSAAVDYLVAASLGSTSRNLGRATALPANLAAGTEQLVVTLAGLDSFNYQLASAVTGQIAIARKAVAISALDSGVTYATQTGAVYAIGGLVAGDDVAPLIGIGSGTATRATTVSGGFGLGLITNDVGYYVTHITGLTGAASGNYDFAASDGAINVTPKTITYTSDGFSAQYGGLTLPVCPSGCELSGRDNGLAYGAVTLNGILAADRNLVAGVPYLSFDGRTSAFAYARNTAAGSYLQIVNGLSGSKAGNYTIATEGNRAGLVFILPAWINASVSGGGRLYTNIAMGKYVSLGTPGVVTLQRSTNLTDAQGGNSFLAGDRVNLLTALVDAKGNIVDGTSNLPVGDYQIAPVALSGPEAANYRLVPISAYGSSAGVFTVSDSSIFNFSFLSSYPSGYYSPPKITAPSITPTTTTSISGTTTTSATAGLTGGAAAGAGGTVAITQTNADGSSLSVAAAGAVGAGATYTPTGATATVNLSGNVSLLLTRGPVTINYGAFVDASAKVEVSLKDLTIAAGGEVMVGAQEGVSVGGNLGSGMTGSTGLQAQVFGTANGETSMSLKNGANLGTSAFLGVGASVGVNGSLTGGGVTGSLGATLYSPGSLYIGAKVESGYADHTMTIGFNLGISLLIGGLEISPKISFSTGALESAGSDFANAWLGLGEKMMGTYCDAGCTAARAKIQADYQAQLTADTLTNKISAANQLMGIGGQPTAQLMDYLKANPDVVHYAQEQRAAGNNAPDTNSILSAVGKYQWMTDLLTQTVAQEKALATRLAADPGSLTAADLALAASLHTTEQQVVQGMGSMFNMRVVVVDGQLTFGH